MEEKLRALNDTIPLGVGWKIPELYTEELSLKTLRVQAYGLSSSHPLHGEVSASAAGSGPTLLTRAYFELLERVSILEALAHGAPVDQYTLEGEARGCEELEEFFPRSERPDQWNFARSNGVAAHTSFSEASERACAELVERDRILRSWFGEFAPLAFQAELTSEILTTEHSSYTVTFYALDETEGFSVVVCVGTPDQVARPLVYGFGAARNRPLASIKAREEMLQRLVFLWEERCSESELPFSPTPNYHQEFFLRPSHHAQFWSWLKAKPFVRREMTREERTKEQFLFADITPSHLKGRVWVLCARSSRRLPLYFGRPQWESSVFRRLFSRAGFSIFPISQERQIHPIV